VTSLGCKTVEFLSKQNQLDKTVDKTDKKKTGPASIIVALSNGYTMTLTHTWK